jgi:hypothetical protein
MKKKSKVILIHQTDVATFDLGIAPHSSITHCRKWRTLIAALLFVLVAVRSVILKDRFTDCIFDNNDNEISPLCYQSYEKANAHSQDNSSDVRATKEDNDHAIAMYPNANKDANDESDNSQNEAITLLQPAGMQNRTYVLTNAFNLFRISCPNLVHHRQFPNQDRESITYGVIY